jgi:hypothetical protein
VLRPDLEQQLLHVGPGEGVQSPERLIEQDHLAAGQEGAQSGGPLAHAARQFARRRHSNPARPTMRLEDSALRQLVRHVGRPELAASLRTAGSRHPAGDYLTRPVRAAAP